MATDLNLERPLSQRELQPYELFMLLLCTYSLLSLVAETFFQLPPEQIYILDAIDNILCLVFLLDFFGHLTLSHNRLDYLRWGWIDLISSVPAIDFFQAGRIVRVIRILRVFRGVRIARILTQYLQRHRADGTFLAVIFMSIFILLLSSVAILQVEHVDGANIETASDALWWAIATMTTVGYGDKFPVTTVGRVIASCLMICGVGMFGTLSGSIASWIMNPVEQRQESDLDSIHVQLASIQQQLNTLSPVDAANSDQRLSALVDAWPKLSEGARAEVERLIRSQTDAERPNSVFAQTSVLSEN